MENQIWISIHSEMHKANAPIEKYAFETEGKMYHKDGVDYIVYHESALSGMAGDKTVLKLREGQLTMHRYGVHKSELIFQEGKWIESAYHTPYGDFEMTTMAHKVAFDLEEGIVEVVYRLLIKGLSESTNVLKLKLKRMRTS